MKSLDTIKSSQGQWHMVFLNHATCNNVIVLKCSPIKYKKWNTIANAFPFNFPKVFLFFKNYEHKSQQKKKTTKLTLGFTSF